MPNVTGVALNEAKKLLKELNLEIEVNGEGDGETIITEQLPKKGIMVKEGTKIQLYIN